MKLHIDESNEYLVIDECTQREYDQLCISYNKDVKNARFAPNYKNGSWDGKINFMKGKYLPASTYNYLFNLCKEFGYKCEIEGLDNLFDNDIDYDEFKAWCDDFFKDSEKKPRYYQIDAAYKGLKYRRCMLQLATSAGKTFIAFMMFAWLLTHRNVKKIMMVVPKIDLVLQPTADFTEYNNGKLDIKIQQIYSGCKVQPDANIYIGTYQSLCKECAEYFQQFDVVLTDECLHPDTMIEMADGSSKKISEVIAGEKVYTYNTNTCNKEIHEVDYVYKNLSKNQQMYELEMEDGTILKVTGNHKVLLSSNIWKRVDELSEGDDIVSYDFSNMKIKKIKKIEYKGDVFNLRIKCDDEYNHNYFANKLSVSNCHLATNSSQIKIMDLCKFPYRIGLSGTIPATKYADGLTLISNFGPILVDIKAKQLQEEGYISNCKITQVRLNYTTEKQKDAFKEANKQLRKVGKGKDMFQLENKFVNESEKRFIIIAKLISSTKKNTMVLFKDKEYGKKMFKWMKENTTKMIYYIDGDIDKKVREEIRKRMEIKDDVILIASFGTSSTGISINKIFNIFFVSSYKSISTVLQSIGRGLRKSEKIAKDFVNIYDISDDLYSGCYEMAHARERIKIYESQGFPYEIKKLKT